MGRDVSLTSREWCDLVFEGKNKTYGAYNLRQTSSRRHIRALLIVITMGVVLILLPALLSKIAPANQVDTIKERVVISNVQGWDKPEPIVQVVVPEPKVLYKDVIKFTPPVMDRSATSDDDIKSQADVLSSKGIIGRLDFIGDGANGTVDPDVLKALAPTIAPTAKPVEANRGPILNPEVMPAFPGGDADLMRYLNENLRYPIMAQETGIEGRVVLKFAVMEDGSINNIVVFRSVHKSLDEEAIRVVKTMPRWIPGKQNGNPVAVYFFLPVNFKLQQQR